MDGRFLNGRSPLINVYRRHVPSTLFVGLTLFVNFPFSLCVSKVLGGKGGLGSEGARDRGFDGRGHGPRRSPTMDDKDGVEWKVVGSTEDVREKTPRRGTSRSHEGYRIKTSTTRI